MRRLRLALIRFTERINAILIDVTAQADRAYQSEVNAFVHAEKSEQAAERAKQAAENIGAPVVHFGEVGCTVFATHAGLPGSGVVEHGDIVQGSELNLVHLVMEDGFVKPLIDPGETITLQGKWEAFGLAKFDSNEVFAFCTFRRVE